jgi:hypothetical protein
MNSDAMVDVDPISQPQAHRSPFTVSDYRRHIVPLVSLWIRATVVVVVPVGMLATRMVVNISTGGRLAVFRVARGRACGSPGGGRQPAGGQQLALVA